METLKKHSKAIIICSVVLVFALLLLLLLGGKNDKPKDISQQHYQYGLKAIEIADAYLDYDISAKEARSQLENLTSREDELPDTEWEDPTHLNGYQVEFYAFLMKTEFVQAMYSSSSDSYDDVVKCRNEIAEAIGKKKR